MPDLMLDRLKANAATHASKRAIAFLAPAKNGGKLERELTYAQVEADTTAMACLLLEKGLKQGDRYVYILLVV